MNRHVWLGVVLSGVIAVGGVRVGVGANPTSGQIRLIVRGDDIGSSHAANVACIRSYREGIVRSVEVMVPCPWFNEAAKMLNESPGLDVGVHLTLTSEWENIKWGPLTHAPSLVDKQGNFYPMVWPNKNFAPNRSLIEAHPKIEEIQRELRAQIELALEKIKNISHLTGHMGFAGASPQIKAVVDNLAAEYKLPVRLEGTKRPPRLGRQKTAEEKEAAFARMLEGLEEGLWLFVEHPGLDTPEMRAIGHKGYEDVAADRNAVTKMFTSKKVKAVIKRRGIKLLSYADAIRAQKQKHNTK